MIFINTEISKMSEPHIFVLNLSQRLDLRNSNKHVAVQNLYENSMKTTVWKQ